MPADISLNSIWWQLNLWSKLAWYSSATFHRAFVTQMRHCSVVALLLLDELEAFNFWQCWIPYSAVYSLVSDACEQLGHCRYMTVEGPGVEPATSQSRVHYPKTYITMPCIVYSFH